MQRTTIKDIANAAGVSHTTVSYVLNGNTKQKISDETRKKVLDAAKELKYVPNETARSLRKGFTNCIVVALEKSLTRNRFSNILQGIREELTLEGYGLLLTDFHVEDNEKDPVYVESVLRKQADGIIYISSDGFAPECSQDIENYKLPFVGCDCCPKEESLGSVSFDYERGAFELACRLFSEGVHSILYWSPDSSSFQEKYRMRGFNRAVERYPGTAVKVCKVPRQSTENYGYDQYNSEDDMFRQSLAQDVIPILRAFNAGDAIICSWGSMVKYLYTAPYRQYLDQFKIAVLSDTEVPLVPGMKILTGRPGFIRGGRESARLLLSQINGRETENKIVIAPQPPTYMEI